ncbi:ABC transporter ATP-binding protein [Jiangella gansuensis]|uniref:dipeptide ABC transporter ATP-binding protein n=1 Tax=Jiangella gansuensis TaxID=281473 RepID=UPI0004B41840|nr:ABC transporter ATP-binding protein [Jiangella gansuensis]
MTAAARDDTAFPSPATEPGLARPLLSVRDLRVTFMHPRGGDSSTVVDGLNLDVRHGGSLAIVGESGSGKTVSMRALLRVLPETAHVTGRAMLGERELISLPDAELRAIRGARIGMVFQNAMSALNPTRTLKVQLTEHLRWHGITSRKEAVRRAVEALDRVGIPEPAKRLRMYPFQLSGGQRQRAMIAMAIVAQPELLIADEPTTALDVTVQRQVLDLLRDLRRDGLALVMITHDLGVARYLCDDIVVMRHGQVVETAAMGAFITNPRHEYSQQLLNAALDVTTPEHGGEADGASATADATPATPPHDRGVRDLMTVCDLVKVFHGRGGDVAAVSNVELTVAAGENVGIVGESGSGKSTLARLITRLIEPSSGTVTFDGADVLSLTGPELKTWRRRVQMVFQNPYASLLPHLTVAANVLEPLRVHRVGTQATRRARAIELLDLVGIPRSRIDHYPRQFSGGQQQRIAIARALALEPDLLVCDEPTSALDVSIQAQILELLQRLQGELGLSMLFITHNLAVAQRLCNRIVVMASGRIMEAAPTADLFTAPQHPYTQAMLAAVLPIHGRPGAPTTVGLTDRAATDTTGDLVEVSPGHWVRTSNQRQPTAAPATSGQGVHR